jgi:Complex 1 protein (LYR family)
MVTSVKKESLKLYRDILRASRKFTWSNQQGEKWSRILQVNARKEFEQASFERDPEILARLLMVGRESLEKTMEKMFNKAKIIEENIKKTRND